MPAPTKPNTAPTARVELPFLNPTAELAGIGFFSRKTPLQRILRRNVDKRGLVITKLVEAGYDWEAIGLLRYFRQYKKAAQLADERGFGQEMVKAFLRKHELKREKERKEAEARRVLVAERAAKMKKYLAATAPRPRPQVRYRIPIPYFNPNEELEGAGFFKTPLQSAILRGNGYRSSIVSSLIHAGFIDEAIGTARFFGDNRTAADLAERNGYPQEVVAALEKRAKLDAAVKRLEREELRESAGSFRRSDRALEEFRQSKSKPTEFTAEPPEPFQMPPDWGVGRWEPPAWSTGSTADRTSETAGTGGAPSWKDSGGYTG